MANTVNLDHTSDWMSDNFEKLYNEGKNFDARLLVGDRQFFVHRLVLATHSKFFQKMFYKKGARWSVFAITAPPMALERILKYFYSGKMDLNQDIHDILETLELARRFGLRKLEVDLTEYVVRQVNFENIVAFIKRLVIVDSDQMMEKCVHVLNEDSRKFFGSLDFLELTEKEFSTVILHKDLTLSDMQRFEAIAAWLKVHQECTKEIQEQLIATVDLTTFTMKHLIDVVRPTKLVSDDTLFGILKLHECLKAPNVTFDLDTKNI